MKYLLLIIVLFFPLKLFLPYHLLLVFLGVAIILVNGKIEIKQNVLLLLALLFFLLITSLFRALYLNYSNPRDYIEIFRFIPLLLLLLSAKNIKIERSDLTKFFFVYAIIDLIVSAAQFLNLAFVNRITSLYAAEYHANNLFVSARALGLSSGPGQHGSIMVFLYVFFFTGGFYQRSKLNQAGAIIAAISILLSQSQTAFIAMAGCTVSILIYYIIRGRVMEKLKAFKLSIILGVLATAFIAYFFQDLRYLYTLVEQGTDRSSFQLRLEKTETIYSGMMKVPELLLTGYGKDYWGELSTAMDNEYLYVLAVYGVIVFLIAIIIMFVVMTRGFLLRPSTEDKSIYFIILSGLVIAYPAAFFTDPRIICLLLFVVLSKRADLNALKITSNNSNYIS